MPSAYQQPSGCKFHTRCPYVQDICRQTVPQLRQYQPGHQVACHLVGEIN